MLQIVDVERSPEPPGPHEDPVALPGRGRARGQEGGLGVEPAQDL